MFGLKIGVSIGAAPAALAVTPPGGTPMPIAYSTLMGNGFDSDGLTTLNLRPGAQLVFVDSVDGNDSYNGLSPHAGFKGNGAGANFQAGATAQGQADPQFGPKKTLAAGCNVLRDAMGDHLMLVGSFPDSFPANLSNKNGDSNPYPLAVRSYTRATPWDATLYGRTDTQVGTDAVARGDTIIFSFYSKDYCSYWAFQGIDLAPTTAYNGGVHLLCGSGHLYERCHFRNMNVSINGPSDQNDSRQLNNILFRRSAFYGGGDNGLYAGCMTGLVVEDCAFWRSGLPLADGDVPTARDAHPQGSLIRTHAMYLSTLCRDVLVRRNIIGDPAATAIMARGGGQVYHNLILRAPIGIIVGSGDQYGRAYPGEALRWALYVTGNPSAGETFTVNGTVFTAGTDFAIGADAAATVSNLKAALDSSSAPGVAKIRAGNQWSYNDQSGNPVGPFSPGFRLGGVPVNHPGIYLDYDAAYHNNENVTLSASGPNTQIFTIHPDVNPDVPAATAATGYRPEGVTCDVNHNVIIGDADINTENGAARGTGIYICNTQAGSTVRNNVVAHSRSMTGTNVYAFDVQSGMPQPTIVQFDRNVIYQWSAQSDVPQLFSATQNHDTYTRNQWDKVASGTNVSSSTISYPNPVNLAQACQAAGYGSVDSLMAAAVEAPWRPWAKMVLDVGLPGYGLSYDTDALPAG